MNKRTRSISIVVFAAAFAAVLAGVLLSPSAAKHEAVRETMRDAVLHETKITFIPYFAWANRGENEMKVWLPVR